MIKYELIPEVAPGVVWDLTSDSPMTLMAGVEGLEDFATQDFTSEGPILDGQRFGGWRARPRDVFLPVMFQEQMNEAFRLTTVQDYLRPGRWFTFRVTSVSGGVRALRCRYKPSPSPIEHSPEQSANIRGLRFVADDPWWTGPTVEHQFQTGETPKPFFETANTHVFNLMSANTVDNVTVTNPGETQVWPIFRIDGPSTGFTISQSADGGELQSAIEVPSGEYLILDTRPTVQSMRLSHDGGSYTTDETVQLEDALFFPIMADSSQPIYVTLNGAGSLLVSFDPQYQRAY